MIFGRKRTRVDAVSEAEAEALDIVGDELGSSEVEFDESAEEGDIEPDVEGALEEGMDDGGAASGRADLTLARSEGPFDIEEVDLSADAVQRTSLGALVLTPWDGLALHLNLDEATRQVRSVTAVWRNSGLDVALFAAPASGGLAEELREDLQEEAQQAGGTATLAEGPFGTEVRRVLPQEGPNGEQLFHVSRIWFAEGPRWLLRGVLLGEAAIGDADDPKVGPFVEFFRNLVVRRGDKPMVPGEMIPMTLPERSEG